MTTSLLLFAGMTLAVCLAPGPNVMLVIAVALKRGFPSALRAIVGVSLINLLYLVLAALGLVALVVASAPLFAVIRYCGAAYLIYLGYQLLRAAWAPQAAESADISLQRISPSKNKLMQQNDPLMQGVITHLSNPKGVLYWAALLPQFLDSQRSFAWQVTALGGFAIAVDIAVMVGYAIIFASASRLLQSSRYFRWIEIFAGVFFIASGLLLGAQSFESGSGA
ncbi:MAG: LysE family translocator [Spongiibacteraceae bacterium]